MQGPPKSLKRSLDVGDLAAQPLCGSAMRGT